MLFLTQITSAMLCSDRDGKGQGVCSLSSYTEPDNEPRVMLSWAGQNRGLTPSSLECAGLLRYILMGEIWG